MVFFRLAILACVASLVTLVINPITKEEQKKLDTKLREAVREEKVGVIESLLKQGANPNTGDICGDTLLVWSMTSGSRRKSGRVRRGRIAKLLILHGANVNQLSSNKTPLELLQAYTNTTYPWVPTILLLLEHGADPSCQGEFWLEGYYEEGSIALFKLLILYGGKFDKQPEGWPSIESLAKKAFKHPLLQAIATNDTSQVKALLQSGYSHGVVTDEDGISALAYAVGQRSQEIIDLLLSYPAYQRDSKGILRAFEIVKARLRGLKPTSPEYQQYQAIYKQLSNVLIDPHTLPASDAFGSVLPGLPPEIWHHILGYLPAAALPVFSSISKKFNLPT
jgi:ankyrin repeat protein